MQLSAMGQVLSIESNVESYIETNLLVEASASFNVHIVENLCHSWSRWFWRKYNGRENGVTQRLRNHEESLGLIGVGGEQKQGAEGTMEEAG